MKKRALILTFASVLAGGYAVAQAILPTDTIDTTNTDSNKPCYYNWADQELPELSAEFEARVQALDANATARANAYGENCTAEDGTFTFGAMETDFYVQLPSDDVLDFESFGNWMARVMEVVDALPAEKIAGPQAGFVEFRFTQNESDFLIVRVPLREYRDTARELSGAELFNRFYKTP